VSAQALSDALWAALAACSVAAVAISHLAGAHLERISALVRRIEANRAAYLGVILGWMWVGWHFFAR
jgi:methylmalonyl-CoA mutase cobalamin-binding subunit